MSRYLVSWVFVALPAIAQAQVPLVYDPDLKTGQVIRTESDVQVDQTMTLAGMPIETTNTTNSITRETVGEATAEGGHVLQGEVETMQAELSLPGGITVSFNSNNPNQEFNGEVEEMIGSLLRASAAAKWKLKTGADHKVLSAEYIGDPYADVNELFKRDTDPELLKARANTDLSRYPSQPVPTGGAWKTKEQFQAGSGQSLDFEKQYMLLGSEQRDGRTFDKVGVTFLTVDLVVDNNAAAPARVSDSDLKITSSEGTLWYDRQARRFADLHEKVRIQGTLTLDVQGMQFPGELDLTMEIKSKTKVIDP
jgi:hypothetical protein